MNNTFKYEEQGRRIIEVRRDGTDRTIYKDMLNFVNALDKKGIVSVKEFSRMLSESISETHNDVKESMCETVDDVADVVISIARTAQMNRRGK